jgi:hypothetical protein
MSEMIRESRDVHQRVGQGRVFKGTSLFLSDVTHNRGVAP